MKNTLLWSALVTLLSTQAYAAEQTPPAVPQAPAAPAQTNAPAAQEPSALKSSFSQPGLPQPSPTINCEYKIPPQTKKIDQSLVLTWSEKAVVQAFSFDPNTIDMQLQKLQPCFTEQGWTGFSTALQKSGNIEAIKSQKLNVVSQIEGQPLITEVKENQWKVTVPIAVVYQNEKEKVSQLLSVDLTVGRKPTGDLGITQMIAAPGGSVTTKKPQEPAANPSTTNLNTKPTEEKKP